MENTTQAVNIEPKREIEIANLDFLNHKKLLQQFFNSENIKNLTTKEKENLLNKIKSSLSS